MVKNKKKEWLQKTQVDMFPVVLRSVKPVVIQMIFPRCFIWKHFTGNGHSHYAVV